MNNQPTHIKLYDKFIPDSAVVPLAGVVTSAKTSAMVSVRTLLSEVEDSIELSGDFTTPYYLSSNLASEVSNLRNDLLVSNDKYFNMYFDVPEQTTPSPDIEVYGITSGDIKKVQVLFKQSDASYAPTPRTDQTEQDVRVYINDTSATEALGVRFTKYMADGSQQRNRSALITTIYPIYTPVTDWDLAVDENGYLKITPSHSDLQQVLYVKTNSQNIPQVQIPPQGWYGEWYPRIRHGSYFSSKHILSTRLTGTYQYPEHFIRGGRCIWISDTLLQLKHPDINAITGFYINGVGQSLDIIKRINQRFGVIELSKAIPATAECTADYTLWSGAWIESNRIDFNPQHGHHKHAGLQSSGNIAVTYYLQPVQDGGRILYATADRPGVTFVEGSGGSSVPISDTLQPLAQVRLSKLPKPLLVDITTPGGGLKEENKSLVDWKHFTDWGYYDGKPTDNLVLVVRIPQSVRTAIRQSFIDAGSGTREEQKAAADDYIESMVRKFVSSGVDIIIEYKNG